MARKCGDCGDLMTEAVCLSCGWSKPQHAASKQEHDPDRHRCAWEIDGRRCPLPGSRSASRGGSGKFFCWLHMPEGVPVGPPVGRRILDDLDRLDRAQICTLIHTGRWPQPEEATNGR